LLGTPSREHCPSTCEGGVKAAGHGVKLPDIRVLTPKERAAPEGAAYWSQIIREGVSQGKPRNDLRAVLEALGIRSRPQAEVNRSEQHCQCHQVRL